MSTELLRSVGLRCTHRRKMILKILLEADAPMSAEEIHAHASKLDKIGFSTTYRVLAQLTQHGILLKNDGGNGRCYFQMASGNSHKHTLHCSICGDVVSISGCPLSKLEERLSSETGYKITGHSLTFIGICPKCQKLIQNESNNTKTG